MRYEQPFHPRHLAILIAALLASAVPAYAQVTFIDRAADKGVTGVGYGRSAAMVDLDGDGLLDLVAANLSINNFFFRQRPDGTFEQANVLWGIPNDTRESVGVLAADFDNDGDVDIYFLNGGNIVGPQINQLLRNDISTSGVFVDVTAETGDSALENWAFGGSALDYDNDGDLDIFIANPSEPLPCALLRNDGNLSFTDVSAAAGLTHTGLFVNSGAGDFDNDGWMDMAAGNNTGANVLYRNNRDGTFTEVAEAAGVDSPDNNFGFVFDDFDNDGWLDVYVPKNKNTEPPYPLSGLYLNNEDGTFRYVTEGSGITGHNDMGHNVNDVDADGYPDIYKGTGGPSFDAPDLLFLITPNGKGGLTATDISESSGILARGATRQHGQVFGDIDKDGDLDIYANNGGGSGVPPSIEENFLWENQGNANNWIAFDLQAVISNRSAVGARAVVVTDTGREVHRHISVGKGFGNTSDYTMHFGLGTDSRIQQLVIRWPSGIMQTVHGPTTPVQQTHTIVETGITGSSVAEMGRTFSVLLVGPPGSRAQVLFSTEAGTQPGPAFGTIGRLAGPISGIGSVTLDQTGRANFDYVIPPDFTLLNKTIYFQAFFARPGPISRGAPSNVIPVDVVAPE